MTLKALFGMGLLAGLASGLAAGQPLEYKEGKTPLHGYLAAPEAAGKHPGVLIIHQWTGLTDYEKGRADQIAKELGYVALAADIYGDADKPADMSGAGKAAGKYKADRKLYDARVKAGLDALARQPGVDKTRLAVIGYCFGGMGALDAARIHLPVKGVVSFHGSLEYEAKERQPLQAAVLVLHGADDPYENAEKVAALEAEMRERKADCQVVLYSGAVHAFTQPMAGNDNSKGAAYNAAADRRSWQAMRGFFAEIFGR
jgi:dienelactone hydrolase